MKKLNLTEVLKCMGITSEIISQAVNDWFVLHFSFKENSVERIDYDSAEECYDSFQALCSSLEETALNGYSVDFPNEEWNGQLEEPAGYGNVAIALKDGVVTDYYELVNPEYYGA